LAEVHTALAARLTPEDQFFQVTAPDNIPGKCFLGESFQ